MSSRTAPGTRSVPVARRSGWSGTYNAGSRPPPSRRRCSTPPPHTIDVRVRSLRHLFNTLDATPFPETDLDADADEFICSWAQELPRGGPVVLRIFASESTPADMPPDETIDAIRHYYAYRADALRRQLHELLTRGYISLAIGLACLASSIVGAQLLGTYTSGTLFDIIEEGVIIGGWVAMWGPIQIMLYDWWPILSRRRLRERLADAVIELHVGSGPLPAAGAPGATGAVP